MESSLTETVLQQVQEEVDDLEEALQALIQENLLQTVAQLPLLDQAKLYVLCAYSIESLIFCEYPRISSPSYH